MFELEEAQEKKYLGNWPLCRASKGGLLWNERNEVLKQLLINWTYYLIIVHYLLTPKGRDRQIGLHLDRAEDSDKEWKLPSEAILSFGSGTLSEIRHYKL